MDHNRIMHMKHLCLVCGESNVKVTEMSWGQGQRTRTECPDCGAKGEMSNQPPWKGIELSKDQLCGLFVLAGVKVLGVKELKNGYWGNLKDGAYSWWFVKTERGWVEIGWRKRVISIDWTDTDIRKIVTEDDVTKSTTMVHAWSEQNALVYLKELFHVEVRA